MGAFLGSPLVGLGFNLWNAFWNNRRWNNWDRNERIPFNARGEAQVTSLGESPNVNTLAADLSGRGTALANESFNPTAVEGRFDKYLGGVVPGYEALATRARGLVGQVSSQNKADVNTLYDRNKAGALSTLAGRGLAGSTVAPSVAGSIDEQRNAELRRVADARINSLLGVEGTFGAAVPQAQQTIGQIGINEQDAAAQNRINATMGFGQVPITTGLATANTALDYYQPILTPPQANPPVTPQPKGTASGKRRYMSPSLYG